MEKGIPAAVFWIGQNSKSSSAWDKNREQDYGGSDAPENRNGFSPRSHSPLLNPFYVELPFNDLAYPAKADQWLPSSWRRMSGNGKSISACQNRWVELKTSQGYTCYAQWEDAAPLRDDNAEYVFGNNPPGPANVPGIGVSPAVSDYLSLEIDPQPIVSWRFVDYADVPPGKWLKYDEMATIYRAIHKTGGALPPH